MAGDLGTKVENNFPSLVIVAVDREQGREGPKKKKNRMIEFGSKACGS